MAPFFTIPKLCLYTQDESPLSKKKTHTRTAFISLYTRNCLKTLPSNWKQKKKTQRKTKKKKKEPNTGFKQIEGGKKEKKEMKLGGLQTNSDASCEPASPALVKVKQKKKTAAHTRV